MKGLKPHPDTGLDILMGESKEARASLNLWSEMCFLLFPPFTLFGDRASIEHATMSFETTKQISPDFNQAWKLTRRKEIPSIHSQLHYSASLFTNSARRWTASYRSSLI